MAYAVAAALLLVVCASIALVVRLRRRTRTKRPAKESSAFVLLEGNAWDACAVDDVREPWARFTTETIRGFCGVTPGRHRVRTKTASGDATLDFIVYPGEVLAWRLDADRARWEPHDLDAPTRALLESAPASTTDVSAPAVARPKLPGSLVHLRTTMMLVRTRASAPPSKAEDDGVDRVRKRLAKIVARAEADAAEHAELLHEARGLGEALVGHALTRAEMSALAAPSRDAADRLSGRGDPARALRVVAIGLAVLPGDPELLIALGAAHAARGEADEALRALNAALERDLCLEAHDVARAMRVRLELRSRLGSRVRV